MSSTTIYNNTLKQIGFTAQGNTRMSSGVLQVANVKTNLGQSYDSSTGKFMCKHGGLFYFSLHLIKTRVSTGADMVYCYIRKNGISQIYTTIDPNDSYADAGSYGTSVSLVVHLNAGDYVHCRRRWLLKYCLNRPIQC